MPRVRQQPQPVEVEEQRARNEEGEFVADDPSTPEVNEAYDPPRQITGTQGVLKSEAKPKAGHIKAARKPVTSIGFGTTKVYSVSPQS